MDIFVKEAFSVNPTKSLLKLKRLFSSDSVYLNGPTFKNAKMKGLTF